MGDNLPNIDIPINEWVDLYALSGVAPGTSLIVENVGACDVYLAVQAAQPPTNHDAYNVIQRNNGARLKNSPGDAGAWAFCNSSGGKVSVSEDGQDGFVPPGGGVQTVTIVDSNGDPIGVQSPVPNSASSVYPLDVDFVNSDFTNWVGDPKKLFESPFSASITNITGDNPKQIALAFNRTVLALQIGLGENNGGDFSNVKISLLGSGGVTRSLFDGSSDNTKRTSLNVEFENQLFNSLLLEFFTADPVSLSNVTIQKARYNTTQIQGQTDDGDFTNFGATNEGNFKVAIQEYGDTPSIDSFARLRVSEPFTIFDSKQLHDKQPLFWDESLGGAATSVHSSVNAAVTMTVTANAADYAIRQTKQRFNYQPGKSQLFFLTFLCNCVDGVTKRIGCFDGTGTNNLTPNNGIFVQTDTGPSWNIAKNGVITESIPQANWNVDTLDGSGDENNSSGVQIDFDATQIAIIDFEWLGVGRVRVGFVIDGIIRYVHYFNHANDPAFTSVYMSTPNLPVRYDIQSDGTAGSTLDHICSTVISEGGVEKTGILRSVESANVFSNTLGGGAGTKHALCGIRLKTDYRDVSVLPESVELVLNTGDNFKWELHLNPTINGTWTYSPLADSSVEFAQVGIATNNTIAVDGVIVASGGGSDRTRSTESILQTSLRIGSNIAGDRDELVLVLGLLDNNIQAWATLNFRELL